MQTIAIKTPATSLTVGQYIHGDGPHTEFQGGTIKAIEQHPEWADHLRITVERDVRSSSQGWLKSTREWVAAPGVVVTADIPLEDWQRMAESETSSA